MAVGVCASHSADVHVSPVLPIDDGVCAGLLLVNPMFRGLEWHVWIGEVLGEVEMM